MVIHVCDEAKKCELCTLVTADRTKNLPFKTASSNVHNESIDLVYFSQPQLLCVFFFVCLPIRQ